MLTKTTIVAGILLAGSLTTASAQTYEPNGNFQALWNTPTGAKATAAQASRSGRATTAATQTYEPAGNFQALWNAPTVASAQPANRNAAGRKAFAKHSSKKPVRN